MKIFDKIKEMFKRIFSKNKYKELEEKNEIKEDVIEEDSNTLDVETPIDIAEDSKKLFHSFKVSTEVLELALEYEKKKKEIEEKEKEIELLDTEIISLNEKINKKTN